MYPPSHVHLDRSALSPAVDIEFGGHLTQGSVLLPQAEIEQFSYVVRPRARPSPLKYPTIGRIVMCWRCMRIEGGGQGCLQAKAYNLRTFDAGRACSVHCFMTECTSLDIATGIFFGIVWQGSDDHQRRTCTQIRSSNPLWRRCYGLGNLCTLCCSVQPRCLQGRDGRSCRRCAQSQHCSSTRLRRSRQHWAPTTCFRGRAAQEFRI